jgi:hypothetical protein
MITVISVLQITIMITVISVLQIATMITVISVLQMSVNRYNSYHGGDMYNRYSITSWW